MERRHLKAKICLVGEAAVGKSSLIRRYVENLYSDSYLMTIGARVSKKRLYVPFGADPLPVLLELAVWDIMGQPKFRELLQEAYFTGVTGIIGVTDLSRPDTLTALYEWIDRVDRVTSQAALVIAANKADLAADAKVKTADVEALANAFHSEWRPTSAKTGKNVEEVFQLLGARIVARAVQARPSIGLVRPGPPGPPLPDAKQGPPG
ncbi:MAG TPA: Rab family GTPase [Thermoplasmata archaeon]